MDISVLYTSCNRMFDPNCSMSTSNNFAQSLRGWRGLLSYLIYHSCTDWHKRVIKYATYWASLLAIKAREWCTKDFHVWTSSILRPQKHGGSFGFQWVMANICVGYVTLVICNKWENLGALRPFPTWEGTSHRDWWSWDNWWLGKHGRSVRRGS